MDKQWLLSEHASMRMHARSLSRWAVGVVLRFGRVVHTRGAEIHVIGRREVRQYGERGIDLSDLEGVQVVCTPDGVVMTVYRNRDLRRLRPRRRAQGRGPVAVSETLEAVA